MMGTSEPHPNEELLRSVSELLQEFTREKRQAREPPASRWERFWMWWKTTGSGALTLVTILAILIGGLWSFIQYHAHERDKHMQQRRELPFRRQSMIVEFHADLADRSKRNRAAYALATQPVILPFLQTHSQLLQKGHVDWRGILLRDVELREPNLST